MPLLPVPEAAPETPVAKVEAPVIVMEDSVSEELPEPVEMLPIAEVVLEPDLEALEEEELAVSGVSVLSTVMCREVCNLQTYRWSRRRPRRLP